MNDWNVLVRWPHETEFRPLWHSGHTETAARTEFYTRRVDDWFGQAEYKLIKDYASHWDHRPVNIRTPGAQCNGTFTVPHLVMDNYTEVPSV